MKPGIQVRVTAHTHAKNSGKIAPGVVPKDVKMCFCFVTNTTRTLGHLSCTDFDRFWNRWRELVSTCVHRWQNFWISVPAIFQVPKHIKIGYFRGGVFDKDIAQAAQLRAMGIVSGHTWHSKDVHFVSEFWSGKSLTRGQHAPLRTTLHTLLLTSGTVNRSIVQWVHSLTSLTRGQHALFESILQWVHRHTATRLVLFVFCNGPKQQQEF